MLPEDRVARTMDLQEDIAAKIEILKGCAATELALLPQGAGVDAHAQAFKDELNRITDYVTKLAADTKIECDKYSNDVKFWAEYRTGIKEYSPWLAGAEKAAAEGLSKPSDLNEVKALNEKVTTFDKTCLTYAKVLEAANGAAQKMTTHGEADAEVAALKERYNKVKATSDEWVKKVDVLLKEWTLLDNTVTELNSWVAKDKSSEGENQFSLEKMESTLGELKNIFKEKEKLVEGL
jgi:predicted nuclease with TOPRIM domain